MARRSFSLGTLFLVTTIIALVTSHAVVWRELAAARAEVDHIRKKYGYIRVEDASLIYASEIPERDSGGTSYRLYFPPDAGRYMLNLADARIPESSESFDRKPTKTISLNGWKGGADVVLTWKLRGVEQEGKSTVRVVVHTETDEFFDYKFPDWEEGQAGIPNEGSNLTADPQVSFQPGDSIHLMTWCNGSTRRGVVLWLEPESKWLARRRGEEMDGAD